MKPIEINTAIAEFCGYIPSGFTSKNTSPRKTPFPRFNENLNAVHIAELRLPDNNSPNGRVAYSNILMTICGSHSACIHATAPQRCEAILRTLGRWE